MERRYKAFISYRHKPLDIETAVKIHRRIERYTIPEQLRTDGKEKLGLVFRDLDELPISSNLSANVREALDHSEFLIVICTPETPKSAWVLREITYFLEHHDRDHVLAVLADGTPDTSFPAPLTEIRTTDGELLETVEPLAANIVADTAAKRRKLFRTESLRILATLIGCPYDALYRREERYRKRRAGILSGIAAVIAAAFIGMLLNRNAQIRAQLRETQKSESRAFAALAKTAYAEGDYRGALQYTIRALPDGENSRPYVPEAELALSEVLQPYAQGTLQYEQSFEQPDRILALDLSMDGKRLATVDMDGKLRFFNVDTGEQLWERKVDIDTSLLDRSPAHQMQMTDSQRKPVAILEGQAAVLIRGDSSVALYSCQSGEELWKRNDLFGLDFAGVAPYHDLAFATSRQNQNNTEVQGAIHILDLERGSDVQSKALPAGAGAFCPAAAFSDDETCVAFLLTETMQETGAKLFLWNTASGELKLLASDLPYETVFIHYRLLFRENGDLLLARDGSRYANSAVTLFAADTGWNARFTTSVKTETKAEAVNGAVFNSASIDLFESRSGYIAFGSKHYLHMLSLENGENLWSQELTGSILSSVMYDEGGLGLVLSNGIITYCSVNGNLMVQQEVNSFVCGSTLERAAAEGPRFPQTTFVTVPVSAPKRIAVIRTRMIDNMTQLTARQSDTMRTVILTSPSGQQVLCIDYDPIGTVLRGRLIDPQTGSEQIVEVPEEAKILNNLERLYLAEDGTLYLEELPDPETVPEKDKLPENTVRVISACGDSLLAAFTGDGKMTVLDRQSGKILHMEDYSKEKVMFAHSLAHYEIRESREQNRLLVFYDDLNRNEAVCIVIDEESWETVGIYRGIAAYLPQDNSVLVQPFLNGSFRCPLFSLEDLLKQAKEITEAREP